MHDQLALVAAKLKHLMSGRFRGAGVEIAVGAVLVFEYGEGFIFYLDPAVALERGPDEFTLSVPIRLRQDFRQSLFDREHGLRGGGDLAGLLVFAGYTHRF